MVEFGDTEYEDELEQELRAALRARPAPEGFADNVVARSQELPHAATLPLSFRRSGFRSMVRWGIAAVLLLSITFGGYFQHRREQRIAGERARQQVLLALRITSFTLQAVRNKVDSNHSN